jgi:ribonuclease Z
MQDRSSGNGDKFLFDVGTGSMANVAALMIPYDFLDKVFLTHLHTDHWGDFATLWAGGWTAGRTKPLRVWGPAGETPEMGTAYAIEHFLKAYNWDAVTRNFVLSAEPGKVSVIEFDYIERFYNRKRRHGYVGNIGPVQFENRTMRA